MINTTKFLPRRTEKKSVLSEKTVINFRVIKKDFKRIDDTLKERLVLSKVRAGILRDQLERTRRRENENALEKRKEDDGTDFDPTQEPKKRGNQGLLTTLFAGLIGGIGFVIVKAIPLFKTIFKTLSAIARPIIAIVRSVGALLAGIKGRLFPAVDDLEDKEKKSRKDIKDLPDRVNQVGNQLQFLAGAMVFNTLLGMIFTGVGAGKVKGIMNVARSKKLLTAASAVKIQKQLVAQKKVARTVGIKKRIIKAADLALEVVEQGAKISSKEFGGATRITGRNFEKIKKNLEGGVPLTTGLEETVGGKKGFEFVESAKKAGSVIAKESTSASAFIDPSQRQFVRDGRKITKTTSQVSDSARVLSRMPDDILASLNRKTSRFLKESTNSVTRERLYNEISDILRKSGANQKSINSYFDNVITLNKPKIGPEIFRQLDIFKSTPSNKSLLTGVGPFTAPVIPKAASTAAKTATRTATKGFSKQVLRQTLGAVPLLGDLAVLLLDIYVFKEIPARAGFKTIGSILGSVIGGLLGGLAATATGGTGAILIPALTILGSIGGDILGGVLYDFLDRSYSDYGPFKKPDSDGKTKISDVGRAGVSGAVKGSTIGKVVKDAGGVIKKGSFVNKGGDEFLFDNDTYMAFNKAFPGLLETANSLEGDDSISAISERLSYEKKGRRLTRMIPIPIPEVSKNTSQNEGSIMTNKKQEVSMLAMNTQTLYRRS